MSQGFPSMTALLGLLAVAGFQNRDKIAEMLGGIGQAKPATPGQPPQPGLGGVLGHVGGSDVGGFLGGGLNDLIERFKQSGHGDTANSWVQSGANQPVAPHQIEQAIGQDTLDTLTKQTGLSRDEILARLTKELPSAVDQYTPNGQLPPRI